MKKKVSEKLKPKVVSLGFSEKELEGVATHIADNLSSEDATDEQIDAAIDAAIPFLKVAQSNANRVIEAARKKAEEEKAPKPASANKDEKEKEKEPEKEGNDVLTLLQEFQKKQDERFEKLEAKYRNESYAAKLTERLKDVDEGYYGAMAEGKTFSNDEEFEAFATKVEDGWKAISQKFADKGLAEMGKPKGKNEEDGKPSEIASEVQTRIDNRIKNPESSPIRGL